MQPLYIFEYLPFLIHHDISTFVCFSEDVIPLDVACGFLLESPQQERAPHQQLEHDGGEESGDGNLGAGTHRVWPYI